MSDTHNDYQREYYSTRPLPRMTLDQADMPYVRRHVTEVMNALAVEADAQVLDMGCGLGKYTAALADRGVRVTGLDLTPALANELHRLRPDIPVVVADAAEPPEEFVNGFDAVTGFFFLHHLADVRPVFDAARRVLRNGGVAAFLEPNPAHLPYALQVTFTPGMTWRGEKGIYRMTRRRLESAARAAGFDHVSIRGFGATPPALTNRDWGRALERRIEAIPGWSRVAPFRILRMQ